MQPFTRGTAEVGAADAAGPAARPPRSASWPGLGCPSRAAS